MFNCGVHQHSQYCFVRCCIHNLHLHFFQYNVTSYDFTICFASELWSSKVLNCVPTAKSNIFHLIFNTELFLPGAKFKLCFWITSVSIHGKRKLQTWYSNMCTGITHACNISINENENRKLEIIRLYCELSEIHIVSIFNCSCASSVYYVIRIHLLSCPMRIFTEIQQFPTNPFICYTNIFVTEAATNAAVKLHFWTHCQIDRTWRSHNARLLLVWVDCTEIRWFLMLISSVSWNFENVLVDNWCGMMCRVHISSEKLFEMYENSLST